MRVYDAQGGAPLGRSRPLEILAAARVHELARIAVEGRPNLAQALVEISWSGISNPSPRDWIGLFPVGGDGSTRLDIAFTRGGREGRMKFPLPPRLLSTPDARSYEFRLYAADGWRMMAQSAAFTIENTDLARPKIWVQAQPSLAAAAVKVSWSGISSLSRFSK